MYRFTIVQAIILFLASACFIARANPEAQLVLLFGILFQFLTWPAMAIVSFLPQNRANRRKYVLSLGFAPLALLASVWVGRAFSRYMFYRDLRGMKEVVALVGKGSLKENKGVYAVPAEYQSLARQITAHRDKTALTVTFWVGGGFPVKHSAYVYRSDGVLTPSLRRDWPSSLQREPQWFQVSD